MTCQQGGVWLAYYDDWSAMATFEDEIDALRHAIGHSMKVLFVEFGRDLREAVQDGA